MCRLARALRRDRRRAQPAQPMRTCQARDKVFQLDASPCFGNLPEIPGVVVPERITMPKPSTPAPEQNPPQPLTDPTVPPMRDPPDAPYRDPTPPAPNDPPGKPLHDPDPPPYSDPPGPVTGDAEWRPGADPRPARNLELVRANQAA